MKLILSWISRVFQSRNHSNCWKAFFMSSWNKGHFFYCISHEKTWMKYIFWYFLLFEFSFVKSIMVMFFGPLLQFFDALYCFVCGIPTLLWFGITFSVMLVPLATGSCYHTICIGAWFYVLLMIQAIYLNYPKKVCASQLALLFFIASTKFIMGYVSGFVTGLRTSSWGHRWGHQYLCCSGLTSCFY